MENKCPKCNNRIIKRNGSFGDFWGCENYPKCKFSISAEKSFEENKIVKDKYELLVNKKLAKLLLKNSGNGVVYIIRFKNGLIKIGKSKEYINRIKQHYTEQGGINIILLLKTRFYSALEVFFHDLFNDFLKKGNECFDIPIEYLVEIPKLKIFLGEKIEILNKEKVALSKIINQWQNKDI